MHGLFLIVLVCDQAIAAGNSVNDWLIEPGKRFGPVHADTSEARLIEVFGADNVQEHAIPLAEGFVTPGTRVFGGTDNEMHIAWQDKARTRPAFLRIQGTNSAWHTPLGLRLGISLKALANKTDQPIRFGGFGWDYGGGMQWTEQNGSLRARVFPTNRAALKREHLGEGTLSYTPELEPLGIQVVEISMYWGQPYCEYFLEDADEAACPQE